MCGCLRWIVCLWKVKEGFCSANECYGTVLASYFINIARYDANLNFCCTVETVL